MDRVKQKRLLAFEQLDARIAMNGDMRPFFGFEHDAMGARAREPRNDFPSAQFAFVDLATKPIQSSPFGRMGWERGFEPHGLEVRGDMKFKAGGVSSRPSNDVSAGVTMKYVANSFPTLPAPRLESFQLIVAVSRSVPVPIPVRLLSRDDTVLARTTMAEPTLSENAPASNSASSNFGIPAQELRREVTAPAKQSTSTPTPLVGSPAVESTSNSGAMRAALQNDIATTTTNKPSVSLSPPKLLSVSINSITTAKKLESMKATTSGMFEFSLRNANDPSKAERSRTNGPIGLTSSMSNYDQAILAEVERLGPDGNNYARKLPSPKGMIEVGYIAEATRAPNVVYKASNSPFEILQLVLGSNQAKNVAGTIGDSANEDSKSIEQSELATREESIFAFAVGTLLAIAIRRKRQPKALFRLQNGLSNSLRRRSLRRAAD